MSRNSLILIVLAALGAGFFGGIAYEGVEPGSSAVRALINREKGQPDSVDFSIFWETWNLLQSRYVDRASLDSQTLVYGAVDGLVKAVGDPYTSFLEPKENENFIQEIGGTFGGVGIEIGIRGDVLTVVAPLKDTPAQKAGIRAGDKIVKIGEESTENMDLNEAVNKIRGPKGTPVKLTIIRGSEEKAYTLIRDTIKVPTVSLEFLENGDVAHLELHVFNRNMDADFRKAAKEITDSKASRIILDVRNNPGGLLDSAITTASYFLDPGQIVTIERFGDGKENKFAAQANGQLKEYPLIVLLNKGSASASEIVAGAVKDNRKVTIVGEQSFGKGSVQEVADLPGRAAVKITIAKWLTPSGSSITDHGIAPDVIVERTEEDVNQNRDPQLDKAKELIRQM